MPIRKMKFVTILLCLFIVQLGISQSQSKVQHFSSVLNPSGWNIPIFRSGSFFSKECTYISIPNVRTKCLRAAKDFYIPIYYSEESQLVMLSQKVTTHAIVELSINNRVFGYTALVYGVETSGSRRVWWLDRNKTGRFTEFYSGPDYSKISSWLSNSK